MYNQIPNALFWYISLPSFRKISVTSKWTGIQNQLVLINCRSFHMLLLKALLNIEFRLIPKLGATRGYYFTATTVVSRFGLNTHEKHMCRGPTSVGIGDQCLLYKRPKSTKWSVMFLSIYGLTKYVTNWSDWSYWEWRERNWYCSWRLSRRLQPHWFWSRLCYQSSPDTNERESAGRVTIENAEMVMCDLLMRLNILCGNYRCDELLTIFHEIVWHIY